MRRLLISVAFLAFAVSPAQAAPTAESKACSDQATAKGLTGKDRESFRAECLKGAAPAAPKPVAPPKAMAAAPAAVASAAAAKPAAAPMTPAPAPKAVTAAAAAPAAKPAGFAPKSPASQACSDQATAKGLHGADREKFRDNCMKGSAPVAKAAKPALAEAVPPEPRAGAKPASAASDKPRTANQLASDQRIKKCGALWQSDKAAGKTGGQTWPKYWSACSARLKAAGQ